MPRRRPVSSPQAQRRERLKNERTHPLRAGQRQARPAASASSAATSRRLRAINALVRWGKVLVGLALLPVCWVASLAFFENFSRAAAEHQFWAAEEFWFFSLGVVLWLIVFFGLPSMFALRLRLYVFGHELTHALWVWASGGRVSAFKVGRDGGYIIADTNGVFISLAPYFFPLYSVAVLGAWGLAGIWWPELAWGTVGRRTLFALVGATWAFHFSFTCWMIPKEQPDLRLHGTFFSLVVIYLANLLVLTALFITACPGVSWAGFGADLLEHARRSAHQAREAWDALNGAGG